MSPKVLTRLLRTLLTVGAVGVALYPMMVLLDLAGGGSGRGLCPGGVATCRNRYSIGPAIGVVLIVTLLAILGGFRILTIVERRERQKRLDR